MSDFIGLRRLNSKGIQSVADLGFIGSNRVIRKRFGFGLSEEVLLALIQAIKKYRLNVEKVGLDIPVNFSLLISNMEGVLYLESLDEYLGDSSLDKLAFNSGLSNSCREYFLIAWEELIRNVIFIIKLDDKRKVILDAKPENFIFRERLFYVDFYPPILLNKDGNINFFETGIFRRDWRNLLEFKFGRTKGLLTRLLFILKGQCLRHIYKEAFQISSKLIKDNLSSDVSHYVESQEQEDFPHLKLFCLGENKGSTKILKSIE